MFFLVLDGENHSSIPLVDLNLKTEETFCDVGEENSSSKSETKNEPRGSKEEERNFTCIFCRKKFKRDENIKNHYRLRHKNDGVRCNFAVCAAVFTNWKQLEEHRQEKHFGKGRKPAQCKVCQIWFSSKSYLATHTIMKHPEKGKITLAKLPGQQKRVAKLTGKIFPCNFCSETFKTRSTQFEHTKNNHKSVAVKCELNQCLQFFRSKEEMEEHFETSHKHKCKICHQNLTSLDILAKHLRIKHLEKRCKFLHCSFYAASKEEMENHLKEKHAKKESSECFYCSGIYSNIMKRNEHIRRKHLEIAIQCRKCREYFKTVADLEKHKLVHIKIEKAPPVDCLFCEETFENNFFYSHHISKKHLEEALRCKYKNCFTFFKIEEDLQKHHEEKHDGKIMCDFCGHRVKRRNEILKHIQNQHLPKKRKCPQCLKLFGGAVQLNRHVNFVHKPRKMCHHCKEIDSNLQHHIGLVSCQVCEKSFQCKKLLKNHKKVCKIECRECKLIFKKHHKLKFHVKKRHPSGKKWKGFECKFCSKFFTEYQLLKKHKSQAHLDKMKYKCILCEKRFSYAKVLETHKLNVHKIGGAECKTCDKLFLNEARLSKHLKWNHDRENPNLQIVECADCGKLMKKRCFADHFRMIHKY